MGAAEFRFKTGVLLILIIFLYCIPSLVLSAEYQGQNLSGANIYSPGDIKKRTQDRNKEIQTLDRQIKALEADKDWLILKINTIEDSGRKADKNLKMSVTNKEKKIAGLRKTKSRLESLASQTSGTLDAENSQALIPGKKASAAQKKAKSSSTNITPQKKALKTGSVSSDFAKTPGEYNELSRAQLETAINKAGLNDWVEIVGTDTCLRLETRLPILFSSGSAKIAYEYKVFIKKLSAFLKPYDVKIQVNGYADTVPIHTKNYPSNFVLGAARAAGIVHLFVNYGLKPSIFKIESSGEYRFASEGVSKPKSFERRAEVTVIFSG